MQNSFTDVYFRPVNPHQYFPSEIHAEEEQQSAYPGVQRLVHCYTDNRGRLMLLVVFKRPGEFNADRICGYQAVLGDPPASPAAVVGALAEAGAACEAYWKKVLDKVFSGGRRDPEHPRYSGSGEEVRPSGHAG
jgi:hypothetical protein